MTSPAAAEILAAPASATGLADAAPRSVFPLDTGASGLDGTGSGQSGPSASTDTGRAAKPSPKPPPSIDPGEGRAGVGLRHMLRQLGGCVGTLPASEGRVLMLRANLGGRQPRPRRRVAALVAMSLTAVRAAERRGVNELRTAHQRGACGNGSGLDGTTPAASSASAIAATTSEIAAAEASTPGSGPGPPAAPGAHTPPLAAGGAPATTAAALPVAPHRASDAPLPLWALLALLGVLGGLLIAVVGWDALRAVRPGWRYEPPFGRQSGYPTLPLVRDAPPLPKAPEEPRPEPTPSPLERRPDQRPRRRRHPVQGERRPAGQRRPGGHG
jgi:hypothetical protein